MAPVIVTGTGVVPVGIVLGRTDVTVGTNGVTAKVSPFGFIRLVPDAVVTVTSPLKGDTRSPVGRTAVTDVELTLTTLVSSNPFQLTAVVPVRFVPVMLIVVEPLPAGTAPGLMLVTDGSTDATTLN